MTLRNFSSTAAQTTLSAGVDATATTLAVSSTTGFPAVPFILAVDAGAAAQELVLVTAVAGLNLTVTRAYDSTVAAAHSTGAVVTHSHAGMDFREANTHVNASTGAHGVTGSVVGTTDIQTLTNKTLALGSNTVSGTRAQFNAALTDDDFASLAGVETLTNKTLTAPVIVGGSVALGKLGYAQVTASQGGITADADITSLSVAVTVGTGRRIRITYVGALATSVSGDQAGAFIKEGATVLQDTNAVYLPSGSAFPAAATVTLTPTAGAHTYKISARRISGTGVIQHTATATAPAFILIEDIGIA